MMMEWTKEIRYSIHLPHVAVFVSLLVLHLQLVVSVSEADVS